MLLGKATAGLCSFLCCSVSQEEEMVINRRPGAAEEKDLWEEFFYRFVYLVLLAREELEADGQL